MSSTPLQQLLARHEGRDDLAPITRKLGIVLVSWEPGRATVQMDADASLHNAIGTLHGGVLCDLADVAFGCALAASLSADERFTTASLQANYLVAVDSGRLVAEASVVRKGSRVAYLECGVSNDGGELVAKLSSTYLVLR